MLHSNRKAISIFIINDRWNWIDQFVNMYNSTGSVQKNQDKKKRVLEENEITLILIKTDKENNARKTDQAIVVFGSQTFYFLSTAADSDSRE